jgi:hypothetical protein
MTLADASGRKLDLGRVFGDTFGVIRRQAGPLIGASLLLNFLPTFARSYYIAGTVQNFRGGFSAFAAAAQSANLLLSIPLYLAACFLAAFQLHVAINDLEHNPPALPEALRFSLGRTLPILLMSLLIGLGVGLGFVFFFVPGLILSLMWAVALPALVADSRGTAALGRSRALTRGNRWRILGLFLLALLVFFVVFGLAFGIAAAITGFRAAGPNLLRVAVSALVSSAFALCMTVGSAALYVQLRDLKGAGGESVAQVFA